MNTVILIGTAHSVQLGEKAPDLFKTVLIDECKLQKVKAIAEEIKEGDKTIASMLDEEHQIQYLYADPGYKERMTRGIATNIVRDIMNEYPEICLWPKEPSSENLPREVWKEYSKRTDRAYRMREQIWLERIISFDKWPLLFICGADHFTEFSKLLKSNGFHVVESHKDWMP